MNDFLIIGNGGKNVWLSEILRWVEQFNKDWTAYLQESITPTIERLTQAMDDFNRACPPELRLNTIEQEYAFRAYADQYNARHPARRISWKRLDWRQRAAAAQDYFMKAPPE